ncbi:MAG: phosphatase PAP2 family protein [Christensenellales bacterium]
MAEWLNNFFATFDATIFAALHTLAQSAGGFFTPLFKLITLLGEKGIIFFVAAIILCLFKPTRKFGVCLFGAVACGALITSVILKDVIMRPRPMTDPAYLGYWQAVGSPAEDGFSFPSGHVTAVAAWAMAMLLSCNKKWSWVGYIGLIAMAVARVYLVAHYASDALAGIIVGTLSGLVAYLIAELIFKALEKHKDNKFSNFVLEWDIRNVGKKKCAEQ